MGARTSVEERAKAMLGQREVRVGPKPGWLWMQGSAGSTGYLINPTTGFCGCPSFMASRATPQTCKHLQLIADVMPIAQVLVDAGAVVRAA